MVTAGSRLLIVEILLSARRARRLALRRVTRSAVQPDHPAMHNPSTGLRTVSTRPAHNSHHPTRR